MTKAKKSKVKEIKTLQEKVLESEAIIKRISSSTIKTIFCAYKEKDDQIKALINTLLPTLSTLSIEEFKNITSDINKLI